MTALAAASLAGSAVAETPAAQTTAAAKSAVPLTETPALPFDPVAEAARQWRARGWIEAVDGMAAVTSLMRAHQIVLSAVDVVLRPMGLTFARFEVLTLLSFTRTGALPLSKLGARLQVHPTSVTNAVDRLAADGLVRRERHPSDRRAVLARITGEGRVLAARATQALNAEVFSGPAGLDSAQCRELVAAIAALRRGAGDFS